MRTNLFLLSAGMTIVALFCSQVLPAQNTAPYWSLAGNSTATTASKLGTTNAIPVRIVTTNLERMRIDPSGRVGIGTAAPTQKLHVVGNSYIVGNELVTGNVGIGTTAPSQKLHVVGKGLFTAGLTASAGGISGTNAAGTGVYGSSTNGSYGVYGSSNYLGVYGYGTTYGVYGYAPNNYGVYGSSGYIGIYGSGGSYGVYGFSTSNYGVYGNSTNGIGVYGYSNNLKGGYFYSVNEYGLWAKTGRSDRNWAGVFEGNVYTFNAYQTSDKNLKKNIEDVGDALGIINKLKPKSYEFRRDGKLAHLNLPQGRHYGVLAQDLEEVLPNLVMEVENEVSPPVKPESVASLSTPDGNAVVAHAPGLETAEKMKIKAVNYTELIPVMVKAMQELSKQNEDLQQQVEELKQTVSKLQQGDAINTSAIIGTLAQNQPNPAKGVTGIRYSIPQNFNSAQLVVTDNLGRVVKNLQLSASGVANVDVSGFSSGVYNYSLIINNKTVQTKKMTVLQ